MTTSPTVSPAPTTTAPILVTGGTGRTGRRVADRLRAQGRQVRITSRTGAVPFDWHDDAGWDAALAGAGAVYLCYSPDLALPGADAVVDAFTARAVRHGVERVVLLSGRGEDGARACEDIALAAAPATTVVRCSWFQENFSEHFLLDGVLDGRIAVPADQVREPFVSLEDVADVATLALTTDKHAGKVLELTGPEALTFTQVARLLSDATGRPVEHVALTPDDFVAELTGAGVHPDEAAGLAWLFQEVLDGRNTATTDTVERVLGRAATPFDVFAKEAAAAGAWTPRA
ncbi:NmrA family transcriptional regulator [Promicromonospora sp. NPDC057488]|uniref:NmrA family transcriptional regulator n=1 Tax=Promicromonospora sp. NPDC057488 TaxID=3346147 RepID=UPI00366F179B